MANVKVKKQELRIGDIKAVEFIKNQKEGRKPVCRINDIVGFINRTYRGKFIEEQSVWHVEICQINDKSLVVEPIQEIKTAFEHKREKAQLMKELEKKHTHVKPKHTKEKINYPYKSIRERRHHDDN